MNKSLDVALDLAARGFRLFPQDRNKHPCIKEWPEKATTNVEQIRQWGEQFPLAISPWRPVRLSGVLVLDVDVKNGRPARKA